VPRLPSVRICNWLCTDRNLGEGSP
jgi:hypothetical protein